MSQVIPCSIENVDPGYEFDCGLCLRTLTSDKYDYAEYYMNTNPDVNECNICTYYGAGYVEGTTPQYKWEMYRHDGKLWVRVYQSGLVVQQYCLNTIQDKMEEYRQMFSKTQ
jgi:hypothetical protein